MSYSSRFLEYNLILDRKTHQENILNGVYPPLDPDTHPNLAVKNTGQPDLNDVFRMACTVGKPYDWDLRTFLYDPACLEHIQAKLANLTSRKYTFYAGPQLARNIGGAIVANIDDNLVDLFALNAYQSTLETKQGKVPPVTNDANTTVQIFMAGIIPEATSKNLSTYLLSQVLKFIFEDEKINNISVSIRNSDNKKGFIVAQMFNMRVIHARDIETDLVPAETRETPEYQAKFSI